MHMRQVGADAPGRVDEGDPVAVVLLDAGCDGEDIGIEDDVLGREVGLFGQELIGAGADCDLALERVGLALFVERHHHHGRAIGAHQPGLAQERLLAFLHGNRVDDRLALDALEPGFDDGELRRIDHYRHARDIRFGGDEIEKLNHHRFRIDQPLVHVDVDDLRAVGDLIARNCEPPGVVAGRDQLSKPRRSGHVGALADVDERNVRGEGERLEAGEPHQRRDLRRFSRLEAPDGFGNRANMVGRRAAASADDVDDAIGGEAADLRRHRLGAFVVLAKRVGQAGVGIGAHQCVRYIGDLGQMFAHSARAERAIETDGERARMAHRMPECRRRLAGKRAPRTVSDGARDHQRQAGAALGERLEASEDRRLGVERVENGLDQDEVGAAVDEPANLLAIGDAELVEADRPEARIVDVRGQRRGAIRRPQRAGDEAAPTVCSFRLDRRPPRQSRPVAIELVDEFLHSVVGLGDRGRGEGVGFENIRAGHRIGEMDVFDRPRLAQRQQIVVALKMAVAGVKPVAAKMRLVETETLDLGAHRPVNQQNPFARRPAKGGRCVLLAREPRVDHQIGRTTHSAYRSSHYSALT